MKTVLILLLTLSLQASVYNIHTEDYMGKLIIEGGDTIIVSPGHSLIGHVPKNITVVVCDTTECRTGHITEMQHLYRTNGIYTGVIR